MDKYIAKSKYSRLVFVAVLTLGLSSCGGGLPVSNVVNLTTKSGIQGDQFVTVRARILDGKSSRGKEVNGARCKLTLGSLSRSFTSPTKIRVPREGAMSRAIAVRCSYDGYRASTVTSERFNVSANQRANVASQGGLLGVLVVGVSGGFNSKADDVYGYESTITVTMSKK